MSQGFAQPPAAKAFAAKAECGHVTLDDDPPAQFTRRLPGTLNLEDLLLNLRKEKK
jgi:hypothetical protein